jgi:hypothetical protein
MNYICSSTDSWYRKILNKVLLQNLCSNVSLKKALITLFIIYFNIELKRAKLTSHTDTKLMDMRDRYGLRFLLPRHQQIFPRWTSKFFKRQLTFRRKWRHGAHKRVLMPSGRYRSLGMITVLIWKKGCINL